MEGCKYCAIRIVLEAMLDSSSMLHPRNWGVAIKVSPTHACEGGLIVTSFGLLLVG